MSQVFGTVKFDVSVPVVSKSEELGLLEANYKFNNERMLVFQLIVTEPNGKLHKLDIHNSNIKLDTYID